MKTVCCLIAVCLVLPCSVRAQQASASSCPVSRPVPTPGLEVIIGGDERAARILQGRVAFEGDEPNARPLPPDSLKDLADNLTTTIGRQLKAGLPIDFDALYFTLHADTFPSREREVVTAPKTALWCLLRRGDRVLLSDGSTHHITAIYGINRDKEWIFILDFWPRRFFMLKGQNSKEYTAELVDAADPPLDSTGPTKLVGIPRQQFLKVLVGVITLDTPAFVDYYFHMNPGPQGSAATSLAFGVALLHSNRDRFVDRAIPLLQTANDRFRASGNRNEEDYSANRLHLARLLEYYERVIARDRDGAMGAMTALTDLWSRYGKEQIIASNRPIDFYRLGLRAGDAGDLDSAGTFFTRAIALKPDYQEAYLYRAVANDKKRASVAVIADTTEMLKLNAQAQAALAKQKAARHKRDVIGQDRDARTERDFNDWKALALLMRGRNYRRLGDGPSALKDGQSLVAIRPGNATGYALIGFAQLDMQNVAEARRNLQKAAELETDPLLLQVIKNALAAIP